MLEEVCTSDIPVDDESSSAPNSSRHTSSVSQSAVAKPDWLYAVSHLDPKYGGLSAVVPNLGRAILAAGERSASVVGFCLPGENCVPADIPVRHVPLSRLQWLSDRSVNNNFREWVTQSAGLHIHGLWQQSSAISGPTARTLNLPYVVSAHGMLESWALANKRWKKALYMSLVEGANLRGAACLHALTASEAEDYRRLHLTNPVAVIPNGVTVPEQRSATPFLERYPQLRGKQILLFLGRIHYKKGIDILLKAWSAMKRPSDAHLVLAGPDFEDTQRHMEKLVDDLNSRPSVTFTGMLDGRLKWSALEACRAFVLPSYSEGLSVSVLEAMGAGKPVIITEHCNLPEVEEQGSGWVIAAKADALQSALEEVFNVSSSKLTTIGALGEELVRARYSWTVIGRQMNSLYRWLEGGGEPSDLNLQFFRGSTK